MTKRRLETTLRYSDTLHYWTTAWRIANEMEGETILKIRCADWKAAVAQLHKLNRARRAVRGNREQCDWDLLVARIVGTEVHICRRREGSFENVELGDGRAVPEGLQAQAKMDVILLDLPTAVPGVFDPNKPLVD